MTKIKVMMIALFMSLGMNASAQNSAAYLAVPEEAQDLFDDIKVKLEACLAKDVSMQAVEACHGEAVAMRQRVNDKYGLKYSLITPAGKVSEDVQLGNPSAAQPDAPLVTTAAAEAPVAQEQPESAPYITFSAGARDASASDPVGARGSKMSFD